MRLRTRLTERFDIEHPIISAPMGMIAGGRLAAAVSNAGGLGLIGGGYGDGGWLEREFSAAGNAKVGCGFITWSLAQQPELLDQVLARQPAAVMLSFGPVAAFAAQIRQSGVPVICQVQSMAHAREAVGAGAEVIVAQGGEAGGHSGSRSTFTLVSEVADYLAEAAPDTLLVAAGGVADGRSLAAALMLGADGVLIGSRLVASSEALTPLGFPRCDHRRRRRCDHQDNRDRSGAQLSLARRFQRARAQEWFCRQMAWPRKRLDRFLDQCIRNRTLLGGFQVGRRRQRRRVHGRGGGIDSRRPARGTHHRGDGRAGPRTAASCRAVRFTRLALFGLKQVAD